VRASSPRLMISVSAAGVAVEGPVAAVSAKASRWDCDREEGGEGEHRAEPGGGHFERCRGHAEEHAVVRAENDVGIEGGQGVISGAFAVGGFW
jgi:hypothetical protein